MAIGTRIKAYAWRLISVHVAEPNALNIRYENFHQDISKKADSDHHHHDLFK